MAVPDFTFAIPLDKMCHTMGISKLEFYEGAALHQLIRAGGSSSIFHDPPFFVINNHVAVYLKYCTRSRSPWGFTFTGDEQSLLARRACGSPLVLGLVCGQDGIAALDFTEFILLAAMRESSIHISCYRKHNEHYAVFGPDGELATKISPSRWRRLMEHFHESL